MKYNEPLIVQELNSLYRRNGSLISKLEKLKHDFRMLLSRKTSDYGQLKEEAEAVYQSLVNVRFEFDFLNSDFFHGFSVFFFNEEIAFISIEQVWFHAKAVAFPVYLHRVAAP